MYETPDWSIEQNNLLMYNAQLSATCLVLPFFSILNTITHCFAY